MRIFLLGGTGPSGIVFAEEALRAGHELTIYARNPSKLPSEIVDSAKVHVFKGEFTEMDKVKEALRTGATVLVSFAGPNPPWKGMAVTEFYERLFPILSTESSIKRCMILSTASYSDPADQWSIKWWLGVSFIKLVAGSGYSEINGMSKATISLLPADKIDWTLFRVGVLTQGEMAPVVSSYIGDGTDGMILSRRSMAIWILEEIDAKKWVGKAPSLSNPGHWI